MMSTSSTEPDLLSLVGPLLIGYLINWGLFGVLSVQTYTYYLAFPNDKPQVKILVYCTYLLEVAQTVLIAHDAFSAFARGLILEDNLRMTRLTSVHLSWVTMPLMSGIVACIVEIFYANRIGTLLESKCKSRFARIVPLFIVVMALAQLGAALTTTVVGQEAQDWLSLRRSKPFLISQAIRAVISSTCDIVIAAYMCYYLSKTKTGIDASQALLCRVVKLLIGSGVLTAAFSIADLGLYFAMYHEGNFGPFFTALCVNMAKLYSNSMLVLLNSRLVILPGRHTSVGSGRGAVSNDTLATGVFRSMGAGGCCSCSMRATQTDSVDVYVDMEVDMSTRGTGNSSEKVKNWDDMSSIRFAQNSDPSPKKKNPLEKKESEIRQESRVASKSILP
ncbi:hypothetical protein BDQ12DRAFT_693051 [Crucibulum laeve]|uniref:DUF6534 domain-containing protein n=1 Tax=Crucibulum laeve TaxID=68775 RepID=A0A5C3LHE5_9AGAR|nr:hypothetical protein BDQ12DRAFT_693051 [Crucibulum laeve]